MDAVILLSVFIYHPHINWCSLSSSGHGNPASQSVWTAPSMNNIIECSLLLVESYRHSLSNAFPVFVFTLLFHFLFLLSWNSLNQDVSFFFFFLLFLLLFVLLIFRGGGVKIGGEIEHRSYGLLAPWIAHRHWPLRRPGSSIAKAWVYPAFPCQLRRLANPFLFLSCVGRGN